MPLWDRQQFFILPTIRCNSNTPCDKYVYEYISVIYCSMEITAYGSSQRTGNLGVALDNKLFEKYYRGPFRTICHFLPDYVFDASLQALRRMFI